MAYVHVYHFYNILLQQLTILLADSWLNFFNYSQLSISRICGHYFLQVQITRSANYFALPVIWTSLVKVSPTPNYGWRKQPKCIFYSDRRFEFRRIRDIRVRDSESRLYLST